MPQTPKPSPAMEEKTAARVAELSRSLGDSYRVRLISILAAREHNVRALSERIGVSESTVSHHSRGLRQLDLVVAGRIGKESHYHIENEHFPTLFKEGIKHIRLG